MQQLIHLFEDYTESIPVQVDALTGSGSNRKYFRMHQADGKTWIGVVGTIHEENRSFLYLAKHFAECNMPVPHVVAVSDDEMCYLQTDLGAISLYDAIKTGREMGGRYSVHEQDLLRTVIQKLPHLQIEGAKGLDFSMCYPQEEMDKTSVLFDLNYFKYCFLKSTGIEFHELKLEHDFQAFAEDLTCESCDVFLYRDFQARNVMLDEEGHPFFIDFQGGRRGPLQYDLVSFLWQASAQYDAELRAELIDCYLEELQKIYPVDEVVFRSRLRLFVLFRLLQVLGAYGFRGYVEQKKYFLESIPFAISNLRDLLRGEGCPYPYLSQVLNALVKLPHWHPTTSQVPEIGKDILSAESKKNVAVSPLSIGQPSVSPCDGKGKLVVRVFSFSYRKGIPVDESGNGGGYVFDCRSTHNPGRYEPYKKLTGLDESVIRFLEEDGEILTFLEHVYALADAHVSKYMERGFTDLMFSFGCTGGQHRSVYSAQHLAEYLNRRYGIEVRICHREQGVQQVLPAH